MVKFKFLNWGKMRLPAFDVPSLKTPYKRGNLADISHTSRVIANFAGVGV